MRLLTRMKVAAMAAVCAMATSLSAADYSLTIKKGVLTGYTGMLPEDVDLVIPDGVKTIKTEAFDRAHLSSVTIPASVTKIESEAFQQSTIGAIRVDSANRNYCVRDGALMSKNGKDLLVAAERIYGAYSVPNGVTTIFNAAFWGQTEMTSVNISTSVTLIDCEAFRYCWGLAAVVIPANVKQLNEDAFSNCYNLETVTIKGARVSIDEETFKHSDSIREFRVPRGYKGDIPALPDGCKVVYMDGSEVDGGDHDDDSDDDEEPDAALVEFFAKAQTFSGYLYDAEDGTPVGTVQVKAGAAKTNRKTGASTSALTVTIQPLGEKKVSAKGALDLSKDSVEFAVSKKDARVVSLQFALDDDGVSVVGDFDGNDIEAQVSDGTKKTFVLNDGATFVLDVEGLCELLGDDTYAEYLPDGLSVAQSGAKWVVEGGAKAGKVVVNKKTGEIDESKLGANPSALKLSFKAKTGAFSGSFRAYTNVKGKPKATTVSVTGLVVDGVGYGVATVKKLGSASVRVE